jgi:hypothetical protein
MIGDGVCNGSVLERPVFGSRMGIREFLRMFQYGLYHPVHDFRIHLGGSKHGALVTYGIGDLALVAKPGITCLDILDILAFHVFHHILGFFFREDDKLALPLCLIDLHDRPRHNRIEDGVHPALNEAPEGFFDT